MTRSFSRFSFSIDLAARHFRRLFEILVAVTLVASLSAPRAQAADAPTITDFSPTAGPVGTSVVINGTGFTAPFSVTFAGGAAAAGTFTSTRITVTVPFGAQTGPITITSASGSVLTATSFTVGGHVTPVVTATAIVPTVAEGSGQVGEFALTLSSAADSDVKVIYTVGGGATPDVDYVALKGKVTFKPGQTSKMIQVVPEGDLGGASKKVVKLTLAPGSGYTVGTTTFVKVKIVPAGQ